MDNRPTKTQESADADTYIEVDADHWPRYFGFALSESPANPAGQVAPAQRALPGLDQLTTFVGK
ncbi:MAG: hypothetical protein ACRD5H_05265 [Nitrososphaerales archaeon]